MARLIIVQVVRSVPEEFVCVEINEDPSMVGSRCKVEGFVADCGNGRTECG
jgi:hypothetical protein